MTTEYPRGSEWRRWDLHIHTPYSYLHNEYGDPSDEKTLDQYITKLFSEAIKNKICAIGITDYFSVDGYEKVIEYKKNISKLKELQFSDEDIMKINELLILPNIELRLKCIVGTNRVNFHVIFSNEVSVRDIRENFLENLFFSYEGSPDDSDYKFKLTKYNLEQLGTKLIKEQPSFTDKTPLFIGAMNAVIDDNDISLALSKTKTFKDSYIIAVPVDEDLSKLQWTKQDHQTRKILYQKAHCFLSSNPGTIAFGLGQRHPTKSEYLNEFITYKPCIHGSDAHSYDKIFNPDENRYCWIKADPTFNGLKQILYEPERVFIGDKPQAIKRIEENKTKIIEKLSIQYDKEYTGEQGKWFDNICIEFNPEMTAIIGNKGSGKTAIAEITALLANSKCNGDDYLFLNKNKFLKKNLASNFKSVLSWKGNVRSNSKNLGDSVDFNSEELVHFVPQRSFEKYCNDSDEDFISEINNVVFSRLDGADKLGFNSFKDLVNNKKSVIISKKNELAVALKTINSEIKELEEKNDINYKKKLQSTLEQKTLEKNEHIKIKPQEVLPPNDLNTETYKQLIQKRQKIDILLTQYNEKYISLKKNISDLSLISDDVFNFKLLIENKFREIESKLSFFDINFKSVLTYNFDMTEIYNKRAYLDKRIEHIKSIINETNETKGYLILLKEKVENKINDYNILNSGKLTAYQTYVRELEAWQKKEQEIENAERKLQEEINYIGNFDEQSELHKDIISKRDERYLITQKVFECIEEEVKIYEKLKSKIVSFIDKYKAEIKNYNITIQSGIYVKSDFAKNFIEKYINNTVNGPFISRQDGTLTIKKIIDDNNVTTWDGIKKLLNDIQYKFDNFDNGNKTFHTMFKKDQYEQYANDLYNLTFLDARYSLRLHEKPLNELSPGERGSLLLVFYLLLDARDIPLIIDQPEDNLDNESVANILVPFIKEAKKRRQIIIITHNSNLAVVSDAEQVIRVKIDKQNNSFSFRSGSLESNIINDVVNVLEGTKNSFDVRSKKYELGV